MKATKEATLATCIETTIMGKGRVTLVVFGAYFHKKETKYEKCHHHHQPQGQLTYQLPIQLPHLFSLSLSLSPPFTKQRLCIYECIDPFIYLQLLYHLQSSYESLVPLYYQAYPYVRLPTNHFNQSILPLYIPLTLIPYQANILPTYGNISSCNYIRWYIFVSL